MPGAPLAADNDRAHHPGRASHWQGPADACSSSRLDPHTPDAARCASWLRARDTARRAQNLTLHTPTNFGGPAALLTNKRLATGQEPHPKAPLVQGVESKPICNGHVPGT